MKLTNLFTVKHYWAVKEIALKKLSIINIYYYYYYYY